VPRLYLNACRAAIGDYEFPQVGQVTISVGYTQIDPRDISTTCVERADAALYYAKTHGRNSVQNCESADFRRQHCRCQVQGRQRRAVLATAATAPPCRCSAAASRFAASVRDSRLLHAAIPLARRRLPHNSGPVRPWNQQCSWNSSSRVAEGLRNGPLPAAAGVHR